MLSLLRLLCVTIVIVFGILLIATTSVESCNQMVCGPVVSKCLLTQSCKCDSKNCTCCKDCYHCLSTLFLECCSCVELCPKPNETHMYSPREFVVEDFEGLPMLFDAVTSESQDLDWRTFKFPIDFDAVLGGAKLENKYYLSSNDHDLEETDAQQHLSSISPNCTVVYMNQCLSYNKCKASCESMGASSLRWFRTGCCECVGNTCINYGLKDNRCADCPDHLSENDDFENFDDDDRKDYGEEMGPLDGTINNGVE